MVGRESVRTNPSSVVVAAMVLMSLVVATPGFGQQVGPVPNAQTVIEPAPPEICALLDIPDKRGLMDGLLFNLAFSCGRAAEFLGPGGQIGRSAPTSENTDKAVNDPSTDVGHPSVTQSETSMVENLNTGTLCSGFNDSCEFFCPGGGGGLTGYSRSTNKGATWQDLGSVGGTAFGDPSIVWRRQDGNFYFATLASGGNLALWSSTDDCQTFNFVGTPATGGDDKELLAVDNTSTSPFSGNLYLVWTDFGFGARIRAIRSTNGGLTWSAPANLSLAGQVVQGAWPTVAPNGDVFVSWVRYTNFQNGPITIEVARSTDGGLTYSNVTSPLVNAISPRDASASSACGRPALNGNIRYLASPQIAADIGGNLHIVYSYDPDGFNVGDVSNVYYRRSTDSGSTWQTEIQLNDDNTNSDQYFPTIQVSTGDKTVFATWYDRRLDSNNLLQDYFKRVSTDNGGLWHPSTRLSDVSSPVVLDGSLATCYHGDYDQSVLATKRTQVSQWADDRLGDPNVSADPGNVYAGQASGTWVIPVGGNTTMSGTFVGNTPAAPAVYTVLGTATPGGTVSGTLTPVNPNTVSLAFTGSWSFSPGSTTKGSISAAVTPSATSNVQIGKFGADFDQTGIFPGVFKGEWKIVAE